MSVYNDFAVLDDLIRLVARAFYTPEQALTIEVLLKHHRPYVKKIGGITKIEIFSLTEEEIGKILKLSPKQVRKSLKAFEVDKLLKR
jgi:hypothetical protein